MGEMTGDCVITKRRSAAWLSVSAAVGALLLLVLALWAVGVIGGGGSTVHGFNGWEIVIPSGWQVGEVSTQPGGWISFNFRHRSFSAVLEVLPNTTEGVDEGLRVAAEELDVTVSSSAVKHNVGDIYGLQWRDENAAGETYVFVGKDSRLFLRLTVSGHASERDILEIERVVATLH